MLRSLVIAAVVFTPVASALAGPGLTLPKGKINVAVNAELELSVDKVAKPLSLSPDVSYGITDALTVALVHSRYATTGFRAAAGGGLCLTGTDGGCVAAYNNVGVEGWHRVPSGTLAVAAGGGLHATNLDAGFYAAKLGLKARYTSGLLAVNALPSVLVAMTEREDATGARLNQDTLWVPVQLTYRAVDAVTVGVGSGIKGPLSGFGDAWQVPLGFMGLYAIDSALAVGASFTFGQIVGGADATGVDYRGAQAWVSYTM